MKILPKSGSKWRFIFSIFIAFWLLKFIFSLISEMEGDVHEYSGAARGFPYPYLGDVEFYIVTPAIFLFLNLMAFVFLNKFPKWIFIAFIALQFFIFIILLFLSSGGI
ncbi:hypothetical protein [Xanthomonas albilineans]|uniref:hypothetical protein n=1 Tax=Xanthomonas albilineans TaxID=29447 RepID=UPI00126A2FE8|nr:hypothetical protein [Xanthomonas albilineans]